MIGFDSSSVLPVADNENAIRLNSLIILKQ